MNPLFDSKKTKLKTKLNSVALVRERTIPSDRRLSMKLMLTFADRGVWRGHSNGTLRPYSRLSIPDESVK
jgi:hypothetical protein